MGAWSLGFAVLGAGSSWGSHAHPLASCFVSLALMVSRISSVYLSKWHSSWRVRVREALSSWDRVLGRLVYLSRSSWARGLLFATHEARTRTRSPRASSRSSCSSRSSSSRSSSFSSRSLSSCLCVWCNVGDAWQAQRVGDAWASRAAEVASVFAERVRARCASGRRSASGQCLKHHVQLL